MCYNAIRKKYVEMSKYTDHLTRIYRSTAPFTLVHNIEYWPNLWLQTTLALKYYQATYINWSSTLLTLIKIHFFPISSVIMYDMGIPLEVADNHQAGGNLEVVDIHEVVDTDILEVGVVLWP